MKKNNAECRNTNNDHFVVQLNRHNSCSNKYIASNHVICAWSLVIVCTTQYTQPESAHTYLAFFNHHFILTTNKNTFICALWGVCDKCNASEHYAILHIDPHALALPIQSVILYIMLILVIILHAPTTLIYIMTLEGWWL